MSEKTFVYVVSCQYEGVYGAFSTEDKAQAYLSSRAAEHQAAIDEDEASNPGQARQSPAADRWYCGRVEMDPDG